MRRRRQLLVDADCEGHAGEAGARWARCGGTLGTLWQHAGLAVPLGTRAQGEELWGAGAACWLAGGGVHSYVARAAQRPVPCHALFPAFSPILFPSAQVASFLERVATENLPPVIDPHTREPSQRVVQTYAPAKKVSAWNPK